MYFINDFSWNLDLKDKPNHAHKVCTDNGNRREWHKRIMEIYFEIILLAHN